MSGLKHWLHDDVPPEIARLLRAARSDSPRRGAIDRAVLMVGSAATVGTATTGVFGAVAKVGTTTIGWATKWGAATLLGVGLGTTAAVTARYYSTDTTQVASQTSAKPRAQWNGARARSLGVANEVLTSPPEQASPSATQQHLGMPPVVPTGLAPSLIIKRSDQERSDARAAVPAVAAATTVGDRQPHVPTVTPTPPQNAQADLQLAEEMRHLDQARDALRQSRPHDALGWLEGYQRSCPAQRMLPEALLLRLRAEITLGNRSAALVTARQIGLQFPESPHAARARELIATERFE